MRQRVQRGRGSRDWESGRGGSRSTSQHRIGPVPGPRSALSGVPRWAGRSLIGGGARAVPQRVEGGAGLVRVELSGGGGARAVWAEPGRRAGRGLGREGGAWTGAGEGSRAARRQRGEGWRKGGGGVGKVGEGREAQRWEAQPVPPFLARGRARPRRARGVRRGRRVARGRGLTPGAGQRPPALTLGFSSDMAAHGGEAATGNQTAPEPASHALGPPLSRRKCSRGRALPPKSRSAGWPGRDHVADARARRACPGRRARARRGRGSWRLGMRHGAGPRAIPAVPTPGDAQVSGFGGRAGTSGEFRAARAGGERGALRA